MDKDLSSGTDSTDGGLEPTEILDRAAGNEGATDWVDPHRRMETSPSGHRYVIGEPLGEGGMAVVYHATDVQLQRSVALKRLRSDLRHRDELRQRFFDEAEILASLDHPGTTSVFEAGLLPDGDSYYAMKKVQGKTLREMMDERTPQDPEDRSHRARFLGLFSRICETVAAAHQQGIIHRDLKPENIMVDDLGVVYVMDWGLAKRLVEDDDGGQSDSQRTRMGAIMGTPAYMSPEQASGQAARSDRQTDVFSLGVMLYEILTGANPFHGKTAVESMKGVLYHDPDSPRKSNRRVDRTISAITMKALAKDPYKRYRSAAELADDIRRYREYRAVSAIEPTRVERMGNWTRRRPRLATALGTLAAVVVVGIVAAAVQASIENAKVAKGYRYIDTFEARLAEIDREIRALAQRQGAPGSASERTAIDNRLAALQAELEVTEEDRKAIGLAITGFTILSPEERARAIVRESIWKDIEDNMGGGDLYRARAHLRSALGYYAEGNILGFSENERRRLEATLEDVDRRLAARDVEAATAGGTP